LKANFDDKELAEYEESLKYYRDLKGVIDTSFEEGEKVGYDKGKDEKARKIFSFYTLLTSLFIMIFHYSISRTSHHMDDLFCQSLAFKLIGNKGCFFFQVSPCRLNVAILPA
jgi:hypothetical protein